MNRRYIKQQKQNAVHCFFDMQLKSGFTVERECYIYNISISIYVPPPPSLYLNIYSGVPWMGAGVCGGCERMLHRLPHFKTISDLCEILLEIFPITVLSINRDSPNKQLSSFFLVWLIILWQCKGILSSKQNHKLKDTKAASTKPLCRIKFIFSAPPTLFRYRYATAYICIYNIT